MIWAVLLLSGCAVGPVFTPAVMELPDRYERLAPLSKASETDLNWWQNFNDPLLTRLTETALQGNLDLAQSQARLREADALARRDGNQLSGAADLSTTRSSVSGGSENILGIGARIGLFGEQRWRAKGALQRLEAARFDTLEARRTVLAELGIAYVSLRFSQASLVTREQDLNSRQRTLRDVQQLLDANEATQLDLLRAQTLVSETRTQIPSLQADLVRQRNRISTLLGMPVGTLPVDLGYRGLQPVPVMRAASGVPADLLRSRPDIRQAERLYAAAVSDLGVAEAARYPSLSLRGVITAPVSGGAQSESLIAGLSMPLFNQPALAASADAANAKVQQAYLSWQRAVLTAVEEVENAQANLQASVAATAEAERLVDMNRRALTLSRDLLSNRGEITVLDVLDQERALSEARALHASSLRDLAADYIILHTVLGQGHRLQAD
jgi:multidrug efflux system outer membrane protein